MDGSDSASASLTTVRLLAVYGATSICRFDARGCAATRSTVAPQTLAEANCATLYLLWKVLHGQANVDVAW